LEFKKEGLRIIFFGVPGTPEFRGHHGVPGTPYLIKGVPGTPYLINVDGYSDQ
jgi:hypothetical protein